MPTSGRRGFTLIEMLMVLTIAGILSGFGYPRLRTFMLKSNIRSARSTVINTLQQAKARALMEGRSVTVNLDNAADKIWMTATPRRATTGTSTCSCDTVGTIVNFAQQYGVDLAAVRSDGASPAFTFDPRGLGSGVSSLTVLLTRGGFQDSVYVSTYGRVTK